MEFSKELTTHAFERIKSNYLKILLLNLSTDKFEPVIIPDDEYQKMKSCKSAGEYLEWFSSSKLLHDLDRPAFCEFYKNMDACDYVVYRRLMNNQWYWVCMEVLPSASYSNDFKDVVLLVRDIDDIYLNEYGAILDRVGIKDNLTGLKNSIALEYDLKVWNNSTIGMAVISINDLATTYQLQGYEAGNVRIQKFSNLLEMTFREFSCYHISHEEFIVTSKGGSVREFLNRCLTFQKIQESSTHKPDISIGYSVGTIDEVRKVFDDARTHLKEDKKRLGLNQKE